ncbi:hypothetical protein MNV49_005217 [Pseudohyphozyma bogoriensis]|nr:hypothetical protein MNV49_005217 [Pseudohyphozyma bogoriensis]
MSPPEIHYIKPTPLIPNSSFPLLRYPAHFPPSTTLSSIQAVFAANAWPSTWNHTYGPTQPSHYHSQGHEVMAVLVGTATIRFGVSDDESPEGALEITAGEGDVFVVPAGVAHKTFGPEGGFTMVGGYPEGSPPWDFCTGAVEGERGVVEVEKPTTDPIGKVGKESLLELW